VDLWRRGRGERARRERCIRVAAASGPDGRGGSALDGPDLVTPNGWMGLFGNGLLCLHEFHVTSLQVYARDPATRLQIDQGITRSIFESKGVHMIKKHKI
jgi:hypothetical protein